MTARVSPHSALRKASLHRVVLERCLSTLFVHTHTHSEVTVNCLSHQTSLCPSLPHLTTVIPQYLATPAASSFAPLKHRRYVISRFRSVLRVTLPDKLYIKPGYTSAEWPQEEGKKDKSKDKRTFLFFCLFILSVPGTTVVLTSEPDLSCSPCVSYANCLCWNLKSCLAK